MTLACDASIQLSSFFWGAVAMLALIGLAAVLAYFIVLRAGGGD